MAELPPAAGTAPIFGTNRKLLRRIVVGAAVAVVAVVAFWDNPEAEAKRAVVQRLRDPGSASFSDVRTLNRPPYGKITCGRVNARNAFGGLAGSQSFVVYWDGSRRDVLLAEETRSIAQQIAEMCRY